MKEIVSEMAEWGPDKKKDGGRRKVDVAHAKSRTKGKVGRFVGWMIQALVVLWDKHAAMLLLQATDRTTGASYLVRCRRCISLAATKC